MTRREITIGLVAGMLGSLIGLSSISLSVAEETFQGEVLSVCINKKTGVIKVSNKCSKEERKTTLGGVGPKGAQGEKGEKGDKGDKGDTGAVGATGPAGPQGTTGLNGAQGPQGERGLTGATGATGQITGLRTRLITVWEQSYSGFCSSFGFSVLNSSTSLSTGYGGTVTLNKYCSTLVPSSVTVYTP